MTIQEQVESLDATAPDFFERLNELALLAAQAKAPKGYIPTIVDPGNDENFQCLGCT